MDNFNDVTQNNNFFFVFFIETRKKNPWIDLACQIHKLELKERA